MNFNTHLYSLERPKLDKCIRCPKCGHPRSDRYKLYRNNQTGEKLDDTVGRCERIESCGYHKPPKQWFDEHPELRPQGKAAKPDRISPELAARSREHIEGDTLYRSLCRLFDSAAVRAVFERYRVGTTKDGRTMFWLFDRDGVCRSGKVMRYDTETGKRNRDVWTTWAHKLLAKVERYKHLDDFVKVPTLFGAHLVGEHKGPVAIVESEKTALICALYWPDALWLASGGSGGLPGQMGNGLLTRMGVLQGRAFDLHPDLDCIDEWTKKAVFLSRLLNARVQVAPWWEDCPFSLPDQADPGDMILELLRNPPPPEGPPGWDDPVNNFWTQPAKTCAPGEIPDFMFDPPPEAERSGHQIVANAMSKNTALGMLINAFDLEVEYAGPHQPNAPYLFRFEPDGRILPELEGEENYEAQQRILREEGFKRREPGGYFVYAYGKQTMRDVKHRGLLSKG